MSKIIVALDYNDEAPALELAKRMDPRRCRLKVGKQLFTRAGPPVVERLVAAGFDVFLDLKYHDIPNTVAGACRAAADLGVWMVNVHAQGGRRMMVAAREAVDAASRPPLLIAVTILTSLDEADIHETGLSGAPMDNVMRLAQLAAEAGMDGVVCSPREIEELRHQLSEPFRLVTPGIR
ncbi:MAG: orotidine-5'-phosphate decarboxylase, partial [Gammaproteobacteria bacterium]|nr:orotidine-5'-phosphate decarboxylase [Gammaproteobacteria bacterium]